MKHILAILLLVLLMIACKKEPIPETGDLLLQVEYDGYPEENVKVWLYDSYNGFMNFEDYLIQYTDEKGEVLWLDLLPGMYYIEAKITKPVNFELATIDSVEVQINKQKIKTIFLSIVQ